MDSIQSYSSRVLQKKSQRPLQKKKLPKPRNKNDSFHESIGIVLTIGQCFAQIPVVGVLDKNYRNARFEICNYRTIYSIVFISMGLVELTLSFKRTFELNFSMGSVQSCLFIIVCLTGTFLLFSLAWKWQTLIRFWQEHEECFLHDPYIVKGMRLKTKLIVVSVTFLLFALMEHVMYLTSAAIYDYNQFKICKIKKINFLTFFFIKERPHLFLVIPFQYIYMVPSLWSNLTMTFVWNYVDLMIILVSIGISTRFDQINNRLQSSIGSDVDDKFWLDIRKHYVQIVDILEKVDETMSFLVILACASNLYYICLQLFHSFTPLPYFLSTLYFWYSLLFLICRTLCVLLFASSVHDTSKKPIGLLRDIPSKLWTNEAQRFLDLITAECNALSGKKFFYLTKNMILAMAGTVVTYELVLLDEVEQEPERRSICNITKFNFSSDN